MEKIINIFGDSITNGSCDEEKGGWVNRLKEFLEKDRENYFEVYNLGISGNNTDDILERFSNENESRNPDLIMVAIGINDSQYINSKDNPRIDLKKFEDNLNEIIKQGKKFTQEIIFVGLTKIDESKLMPIPWDNTKYYDDENVSLYNAKVKEICEKNNLLFIDMEGVLENEDLEDGLHPNAKGHEKMFQWIKDFLTENKII